MVRRVTAISSRVSSSAEAAIEGIGGGDSYVVVTRFWSGGAAGVVMGVLFPLRGEVKRMFGRTRRDGNLISD
jgi:hypothetical protein